MDVQLQELIDKIRQDGMAAAQAEAERIRAAATAEAASLVESARREAAALAAKTKADAERTEQAGRAALAQASRNLVLEFRGEIDRLVAALVRRETAAVYDAAVLRSALPDLLRAWANGGASVDLMLPPAVLKELEAFFADRLAAELKAGLTLKPDRSLDAGFRIAAKDGSAYYDFSAETVAELLSAYLNPRLAEILKSTAKGA
jgi:V/A-type H+-transporting ATPase subunit E